jgi:MFS transporter, putative metabolite:H+ symporter
MTALSHGNKILTSTVIVTALGYLVDVYDMLVFNVTRVASLTDLGLSGDALTNAGLFILNMQLLGFLLGGLFFGVLGDKMGRKTSLMGSILLYSFATLACAFVQNTDQYAILRFIAGFGLAGEIGVGVALITETLSKEKRGLGVTFFGFIGISGAVIAAVMAETLSWRICYIIGGVAGLLLLLTRSMVLESGMFEETKKDNVKRGSLRLLFTRKDLIAKYIRSVLLGAPIFFVIGIVWTLAPEIGKALGATAAISAPITIGIGYAALMLGDVLAGLLSHHFQSRRSIIGWFLLATAIALWVLLHQTQLTPTMYYIFAAVMGIGIGYWVNLITLSAEQFGTNLRATASTSIPNFARATLLPLNLLLAYLKEDFGILTAVAFCAAIAFGVALYALAYIEETFHKDLNYND